MMSFTTFEIQNKIAYEKGNVMKKLKMANVLLTGSSQWRHFSWIYEDLSPVFVILKQFIRVIHVLDRVQSNKIYSMTDCRQPEVISNIISNIISGIVEGLVHHLRFRPSARPDRALRQYSNIFWYCV